MNRGDQKHRNRDALKLLGLLLTFTFGFLGATPFLANKTFFYDKYSHNFSLDLGPYKLASLTHDVNGTPIGTSSAIDLVVALLGVALLVGVFTFAPTHKSRHVITHRS